MHAAQKFEGVRIDETLGVAAGRKGAEASRSLAAQNGFGHDRPGGVPGAKEQNIEYFVARLVHRDFLRLPALLGAQTRPASPSASIKLQSSGCPSQQSVTR